MTSRPDASDLLIGAVSSSAVEVRSGRIGTDENDGRLLQWNDPADDRRFGVADPRALRRIDQRRRQWPRRHPKRTATDIDTQVASGFVKSLQVYLGMETTHCIPPNRNVERNGYSSRYVATKYKSLTSSKGCVAKLAKFAAPDCLSLIVISFVTSRSSRFSAESEVPIAATFSPPNS